MKIREISDSVRESVMAELRKSFRPEFLNRVDETILFKPLTLEEITSIVDLNSTTTGSRTWTSFLFLRAGSGVVIEDSS